MMFSYPDLEVSSTDYRIPDIRVGIILLEGFALLSLSGLCETLRMAGEAVDREQPVRCSWSIMTSTNQPVCSSSGFTVAPWECWDSHTGFDYIAVIGGDEQVSVGLESEALLTYLNRVHQADVVLIGISYGSIVLCDAGVLQQQRCAVTAAGKELLQQRHPQIQPVTTEPFVLENGCYTCGNGVASIQLALSLIARHYSPTRAIRCADFMSAGALLSDEWSQPHSGRVNRHLQRAVDLMTEQLGRPCSVAELARAVGTSRRQLERIFMEHTGESPAAYWRRLRLNQAKRLLASSSASITQIAQDCGFSDASHFTRSYKDSFGELPGRYRRHRRLVMSETVESVNSRNTSSPVNQLSVNR